MALHVVALAPVAEFRALDALQGETGPQGDGAGGGIVRTVPEFEPVEPQFGEGRAISSAAKARSTAGASPDRQGRSTGPSGVDSTSAGLTRW